MSRLTASAAIVLLSCAASRAQLPDDTTTTVVADETTTTTTEPDDTSTTIAPPETTTTLTLPIVTTTVTLPIDTTTVTVPLPVTTTTTVPGACLPGTPVGCEDGNPCTLDVCDPVAGCLHTPLADTVACDDGDPCTENDRCVAGRCAGTPRACSDSFACTRDFCVDGVCFHELLDARCDRGQCEVGSCRPGDAHADRRGCVAIPVRERKSCTDDGFSCTDDVCTRGVCLHVPVDSRCLSSGACSAPQCAPAGPGQDAAGCVAGPPRADGASCAEDGVACTLDVCREGACVHEPTQDVAACAPLETPFREAMGLSTLAAALAADLAPAAGDAGALLVRLARIERDLSGAAAALAGEAGAAPALAGPAVASALTPAERARIAFTMVLRTPRQISTFLQLLVQARVRATLGRPATHDLRGRGRALLRGARRLRLDLRHVGTSRGYRGG